ncbi:hypothetical protein SFC55_24595 [Niallia taxi]|uniref:hypothetical protein n=1 Tax=Niallia taxi TaxID=2499688 RepID=UPI00398199E7
MLCKDILKKHNLNNIILEEFNDPTYVMSYNHRYKTIRFNSDTLFKDYKNTSYGLSFDEYIVIIMYHEIGHALDGSMDLIMQRIAVHEETIINNIGAGNDYSYQRQQIIDDYMTLEIDAWKIAEALIAEVSLMTEFHNIKNDSLEESEKFIRDKVGRL